MYVFMPILMRFLHVYAPMFARWKISMESKVTDLSYFIYRTRLRPFDHKNKIPTFSDFQHYSSILI